VPVGFAGSGRVHHYDSMLHRVFQRGMRFPEGLEAQVKTALAQVESAMA